MGENSKITWTHHTFNPWRGCTAKSPGCDNCYAAKMSERNPNVLGVWGVNGTRPIAAESYWRQPFKWNEAAENTGQRARVFCGSLMDVFEAADTIPPKFITHVNMSRGHLFDLIARTPWLDWLLLTKRPENIWHVLERAYHWEHGGSDGWIMLSQWLDGQAPKNVWLGASAENREMACERHTHLIRVPAAVHFWSCEPLLGWIDPLPLQHIEWVITGGESGPRARACNVRWIKNILEQCEREDVPAFNKQLGARFYVKNHDGWQWPKGGTEWIEYPDSPFSKYPGELLRVRLADSHGADPLAWPEHLRVQEFPRL